MIIIDIGAGRVSEYQKWLSSHPELHIYCVEPHPETYKTILIAKNQMQDTCINRCHVINVAIISKQHDKNTEHTEFYLCNDPNSSSTLPFVEDNVKKWKYPIAKREFRIDKTINIRYETLNQLLDENGIRNTASIDLLNIDTQGNSLDILRSLNNVTYNNIKRVRVKVHSKDMEFDLYKDQSKYDDVMRFLKSRYLRYLSEESYSRDQEKYVNFVNEQLKISTMTI